MAWKDMLFKAPEPGPAQATAQSTSLLAARLRSIQGPLSPVASPIAASVVDPEFTADILEAMGKSTLPGFRQFNEQMELLADAIPDEAVRIKKALQSAAKFLNLTPEQITAAVQEQLDLAVRAKNDFDAGLRTEVDTRTTTCSNHLRDVDARLSANQIERDRLTTDRNDTQRQLDGIQAETSAVTARFTSAFQPLYETLTSTLLRLRAR